MLDHVRVLAGVVAGLLATLAPPTTTTTFAGPPGPESPCGWIAPVDAPIVDTFRPPEDPYGPGGNLGLEYGTEIGQPVAAVAAGRVSFAGPVGGRPWVVVSHDDGLRSTVGPLVAVAVVRGTQVGAGHGLGSADTGLHLTARAGDVYLDPAPLLDGVCGRPRLVPGS